MSKQIAGNHIFLPSGILDNPKPMDTHSFPGVKNPTAEINEKYLRLEKEKTPHNMWFIIYAITLFFFGLPLFVAWNSTTNIFPVIILIVSLVLCIIWIGYRHYLDVSNKYPYLCEFNRMNGAVTYVNDRKKNKVRTILFTDCQFEIYSVRNRKDSTFYRYYAVLDRQADSHPVVNFLFERAGLVQETMDDIIEFHSFLQWYMDKNRPLPPGKIFDLYREKDFECRKKEGFQLPLCASLVDTIDIDNVNRFEDLNKASALRDEIISIKNKLNK